MSGQNTTKPDVTFDHFAALDIRVGIIQAAENIPKKTKLLKLAVDIGEEHPRTIVSGLALAFTDPSVLVGRRVLVVTNLAPRDFGKGLVSHGMILAAPYTPPDCEGVDFDRSRYLALPSVTAEVEPGAEVSLSVDRPPPG